MDTMTSTKILGGFCGAFLIFLLGKWAADVIYQTGSDEQAYVIDTGEGDGGEAEEGPDFAELLASADPAKGERVYSKCRACHKVDPGANGTGPTLYGVVGRDVGGVDGYGYSGALVAVADVWTPENLDGFLADPKGYAPGTKMSFAGLKKAEDRANLIAWLDGLDN